MQAEEGSRASAPVDVPVRATLASDDDGALAISTALTIAAAPEAIPDRLLFYEQLDGRPPWHLRLLLPVPIETIGRKSQVGDEARCVYEGGHLIKRVTAIDPPRSYEFSVVEQELSLGGGMRLAGGDYRIRPLGDGRCELRITTRYHGARRPRWMWRPIERAVCHSFHRHLLRAMRRAIEVA